MAAVRVSAPPRRQLREEFPVFHRAIYLNSCSLGALSSRSHARVNEYLDPWERRGAAAWYDVWWTALADLRDRYARVIEAATADPVRDVRRLAEAGIVVHARPAHVRVSPCFYNVPDDHLELVELLKP
jgi:selenocysteine lyase/cysteine desulfurase